MAQVTAPSAGGCAARGGRGNAQGAEHPATPTTWCMRFQFDEEMALAESQRPFLVTLCSFKTNCLFCLFPSSFFALLRGVSLLPELCYVCVALRPRLGLLPPGMGWLDVNGLSQTKSRNPVQPKKARCSWGHESRLSPVICQTKHPDFRKTKIPPTIQTRFHGDIAIQNKSKRKAWMRKQGKLWTDLIYIGV